jgi:hypothetical protein
MKIYYFNDEKQPVTIQVNGQLRPSATNKYGDPQIEYFTLKPLEARVFDVDAPEGSIPYVKRWESRMVLLSYLQADSELLSRRDGDEA